MKKIIVFILLAFTANITFSQSNVVEYLKAGTADANKLMEAYLDPFAMGLGDGLNNGWYYTAKTHKRFGFDFSMSVSAVKVPESAQYFDLNELQLSNVALANNSESMAPTVSGPENDGPVLRIKDAENQYGDFNSPPGMGIDIIPVPIIQLGIGLLPYTDVLVRYVPKISFDQEDEEDEEVEVGMLGFGVKHSFKDWIPGLKHLPFDASLFASYGDISSNTDIDFSLSDFGVDDSSVGYTPDENQKMEVQIETFKAGLILSKKVAFITFFGSVGNSRSKTRVDLLGRYPVGVNGSGNNLSVKEEIDPIKLRFKSSNVSLDAGIRMKMAFFNIFASVNKAEYASLNAGISLSVR